MAANKDEDDLFSGGVGEVGGDALRPVYRATDKLGLDLTAYPVELLLALRAELDEALPPMKLSMMNLEEELVRQFHTAKALQTETLADRLAEANKKAQVVNTTAATLQSLIKMQSDFYSSERFKKIEMLLIKTLREFDQPAVAHFFEVYERDLQGAEPGDE